MMKLSYLKPYLDDIESRINPVEEDRLISEWLNFCDLKCTDPFFSPLRNPKPSKLVWKKVLINDAFKDPVLMLYSQLKLVSDILSENIGILLNVRANYGTGVIPTMFGSEVFYLKDETDTLPCTRPLKNGPEQLFNIVAEGKVDYSKGLSPAVFNFGEMFLEATKNYPLISKYVNIYNPDLQGPFPLIDEIAGSDIYYSLYEDDDKVHESLAFITDVFLDFSKKWQSLCPTFDETHSVEWGLLHKGKTIIRNDAIVNLSNDMYREFAMPYDQKIINELHGGIHFCGRGDHYISSVSEIENLSCINMSQPELNNMDKIYQNTIDKGIIIIGMPVPEIARATSVSRNLKGRVQSGAALAAYRPANL